MESISLIFRLNLGKNQGNVPPMDAPIPWSGSSFLRFDSGERLSEDIRC